LEGTGLKRIFRIPHSEFPTQNGQDFTMNKTDSALAESIDWQVLLFNLKAQKLVPFLGAGASLGSDVGNGLPGGGKLAGLLADECGYPGKDRWDLLRVAQYYSLRFGELGLRESLQKKFTTVSATRKHKKISVYNCDALAFLRELDRRYRESR
jgi:hypothetical protein